jgi:hypothetical protein
MAGRSSAIPAIHIFKSGNSSTEDKERSAIRPDYRLCSAGIAVSNLQRISN